jgi:hypothetical protein
MMTLITDIQYFPSVVLYKILYKYSNIIFNQYDWHKKTSFRNRTRIAGANGIIGLSIPLIYGRDQKRPASEVRIDNSKKWQSQHWKSIQSCYNRSPWFEYYRQEVYQLYQVPYDLLTDWNLACFEWTVKKLNISLDISLSESRGDMDKNKDQALDLTNKLLPKNYKQFGELRYHQVFEERLGFIPNLSILDLLFCEGKRAAELLA